MTVPEQTVAFTETPQVSNKHFNDRDQRLRRRRSMTRHRQNSSEHNKRDRVINDEEEEEEEEGQNFRKKIDKTSARNSNSSETICQDIDKEREGGFNGGNSSGDDDQHIPSIARNNTSTRTGNNDRSSNSNSSTRSSNKDYNKRHYLDTEDMDLIYGSIMDDEDLLMETNTSKNPIVIDSESVRTENNSSSGSSKRQKLTKSKKKARQQKRQEEEDGLDESNDDDNQEKYEVEAILGHKVYRNMVVKYEIKWVGYPHKFNTWEPSSSIHEDCPNICISYWSKHEPQPINAPTTTPTTTGHKQQQKNESIDDNDKSTLSSKQKQKEYIERLKKNKITNEDLHYSLRNQGFELAYGTGFPTETTDWIFEMRQIHLVQKVEGTDQILAYVSWQNRKKTVHVVQELHDKCPGELIGYYEARIRFED